MSDKFTWRTLSKVCPFSLKDANCLTPLLVQWTHLYKMDTWALSFWFSYLEGLTSVHIFNTQCICWLNSWWCMTYFCFTVSWTHSTYKFYPVAYKINGTDFFLFNHLACRKMTKIWTKLFYHLTQEKKCFNAVSFTRDMSHLLDVSWKLGPT